MKSHYLNFRIKMGNDASLPLECAAFDGDEIRRLGKRSWQLSIFKAQYIYYFNRFKKLDLDGSGSLSIDEFMSLPELQQNPLVR